MSSVLEEKFQTLFDFIEEGKLPLFYDPSRREFSIISSGDTFRQVIFFCPWTGNRLPYSVADELNKALELKELSIIDQNKWPSDLRSERWWIDQGL